VQNRDVKFIERTQRKDCMAFELLVSYFEISCALTIFFSNLKEN
jgi:hypothetical protein